MQRANKAYLQHGTHAGGCFMTEGVDCKESPLPHHEAGLSYTATGYGKKLPTRYMIKVNNGRSVRWYRVYSVCFSNVSTEYIVMRGETVKVDLVRV